ncbi:MAG: DUF3592 domain-containing protein [Anaerolineae bacterium]|nr:DUF3592 domain-containing protein [Anaerolineae bacterium]NUQ05435.1 DUF3592 domain-containing protein [Anaerolineae bacterium]
MDFSGIFGNTQNFVIIATTLPVLVIVVILAGVAVTRTRRARSAASSWATTTGQVVASGAQAYRSRSGTGGSTTMYRPAVSYLYTVNGRQYASDRMSLGLSVGYGSSGIAERTASKYPAGSMVVVHYNPENPAEATLETTARGSGLLWLIVVILLIILAVSLAMTVGMGGFLNGILGNFF